MGQLYTTGPALLYVKYNGAAAFFGTAEHAPRITVRPQFMPVMNDLGGQMVPFDGMYQGQDGVVTAEVNRFNFPILEWMQAIRAGIQTPGVETQNSLGEYELAQGNSFDLWITFPQASLPFNTVGGMPAGYHFPASVLEGPDDIQPGSQPFKVMCTWHCYRQFAITGASTWQFTLFDHNVSGLPAIN